MELVYTKKLELNETLECKNKELNLEYYLLSSEDESSRTYGIQINIINAIGETDTAIINDVLSSRTNMIELIKLFHSNSVTPVSARDVIYDCIS
jgi:hypothetical protein